MRGKDTEKKKEGRKEIKSKRKEKKERRERNNAVAKEEKAEREIKWLNDRKYQKQRVTE